MRSAEITKKIPLELLCIHLLGERDMYGYEMVQEIKKRSDGLLKLNITTLYLALKRLNDHGYVSMYYSDAEAARERSRIYYHLEPTAEEYRQKLEEEYERVTLGVRRFLEFGGACSANFKQEFALPFSCALWYTINCKLIRVRIM